MATLYENYNTGDENRESFYGAKWNGQTFTPSVAHKITSVKLKIARFASPGTITVGIRATDGSGHPTGSDLCSGTTDGNTLTTAAEGEWREITLGAGYDLSADAKYAIVARALTGDASNLVFWRKDTSVPTYGGGNEEKSTDSGSSWNSFAPDYMFEDWGDPSVIEKTSSDTGSGSEASAPTAAQVRTETGSGSDVLAQAQAILNRAEAGGGADTLVGSAAALVRGEAGSGGELSSLLAALAAAENGSGTDAGVLAALFTLAETSSGVDASESLEQFLEKLGSDTGSGIEALLGRGVFLAEAGDGGDTVAGRGLTLTELGAGADLSSVIAAILHTDAGSSYESRSLSGFFTRSDTGSSLDALDAALAELSESDEGSGAEGLSLSALFGLGDNGLGEDAFATLLAVLVKAENGTGAEALLLLSAMLTGEEAGSGTEALLSRALALAEEGSALEALSLLASLAAGDAGAAAELAGLISAAAAQDTGAGTDTGALIAALSRNESGSGLEQSILDAIFFFFGADSGAGTDAILSRLASLSESGQGRDRYAALLSRAARGGGMRLAPGEKTAVPPGRAAVPGGKTSVPGGKISIPGA